MTNKIVRHKDKFNHWIEFYKEGESDGRSLEASAYRNDVVVSVFGAEYRDRDNYVVNPSEEFPLNLEETKALRDFLNEAIEKMEKEDDYVE